MANSAVMMNKVLLTLMVADLVYFGTGGVLLGLAVKTKIEMDQGPMLANVAGNLLLLHTPWTGTRKSRCEERRRKADLNDHAQAPSLMLSSSLSASLSQYRPWLCQRIVDC